MSLTEHGQPVIWTDKSGVTHFCDGDMIHPGVRLLWAACATGEPSARPGSLDVPANAAWGSGSV